MMILCVRVYRLHGDQVLLGGSIGCPQEGADGNWGQFSLFFSFLGVGVGSVFSFFLFGGWDGVSFLLFLSLFWGLGQFSLCFALPFWGAGASFPLLPLLSPEPSLSVFR